MRCRDTDYGNTDACNPQGFVLRDKIFTKREKNKTNPCRLSF